MSCTKESLTALDAFEHTEKMFAEFLEKFPDERPEIRGVSIHEDGTLRRKRRQGYFFMVDFADGSQIVHEFSWPLTFVWENPWYCGVFVGMISGRLRDLEPDAFSIWIMTHDNKSGPL